ncbi:serpin B [Paenibacillus cellulosilyticus]|uniref:Serpin B n=1 Tax=Paenibacillus cellulosilyticus TaxID=375489 RepID=A0A2V2YW84_9BACL|nr:serpin family protein [Paenibacillus cellulosilyticus]PWW05707.1 serpin B [Paenibacillus cellulosilyticus]QKS45275.1 serpin family protein [Paenibacillus cellulosilyticus]
MNYKRIAFIGLASLLLAGSLTACGSSKAKSQAAISMENRDKLAAQADQPIIQASNNLGLRLHQQLLKEKPGQNVFLSPVSISTALAMVYNGSGGETKTELERVLGWTNKSVDEINTGYRELLKLLNQPGEGITLNIADSVWHNSRIAVDPNFSSTIKNSYEAEEQAIDVDKPEKSAKQINDWISDHTSGMIDKLIEPDSIDASLVMVLLNAVYFNGTWKDQFDASFTMDHEFLLADGSRQSLPFMNRSGRYSYTKNDDYEAIRLPYGQGQMSMVILLPSAGSTLEALQDKLWNGKIGLFDQWRESYGQIRLPKFSIGYTTSLKEALQALSMKLSFTDAADFSSLSSEPDVFISEIKHKSIIDVSEEGTKAAAVTSIEATTSSAEVVNEPFDMVVDRPFFLAIVDEQSDALLFSGSIYNPADTQ